MSRKSPRPQIKLKALIKRKWLKALRSDEYDQGTGSLYDAGTDRYCCLGVLGAVCGVPLKKMDQESWLTKELLKSQPLGSESADNMTGYEESVQEYLGSLNDNKKSFKQIAQWIERHL